TTIAGPTSGIGSGEFAPALVVGGNPFDLFELPNAASLLDRIDRTTSIELVDVDGDHDLDILTGNLGQPTHAYFNDGSGAFSGPVAMGVSTLILHTIRAEYASRNAAVEPSLEKLREVV